jgi:hypothetical protein
LWLKLETERVKGSSHVPLSPCRVKLANRSRLDGTLRGDQGVGRFQPKDIKRHSVVQADLPL